MQNITQDGINTSISETKRGKQETKPQNNFDEKNYLNVRLKKGEMQKEIKIRLLPIDKDSNTPFKIIKMHTVKVPTEISEGGWKSYVCLKQTTDIDHEKLGNKCPFCEKNSEAYEKYKAATDPIEKETWKRVSLENKASEVCVVRCIERGREEDGPKFWKFGIRTDGKDPYNMMLQLDETRKKEMEEEGEEPVSIFDIYNGKDLKITIQAVTTKDGEWTNKTSISVLDFGKQKPISQDREEMERWGDDEKKWNDVFVAKPYEYLSIIQDGEIPFFDRECGVWVKKIKKQDNTNDVEESNAQITNSVNSYSNASKVEEKPVVTQIKDEVDSDLPF